MMKIAPKASFPVLAALALASCGGGAESESSVETENETAVNASETAASGILTAEYLQGDWCFEHYSAGNEVEEQQITYRFNDDGTLLYQNNSGTPIDEQGSYELDRTGIRILPAFSAFPAMRAGSIDPDRLTLIGMGAELVWTRGACTEETE